jgi:hypothetical protein
MTADAAMARVETEKWGIGTEKKAQSITGLHIRDNIKGRLYTLLTPYSHTTLSSYSG